MGLGTVRLGIRPIITRAGRRRLAGAGTAAKAGEWRVRPHPRPGRKGKNYSYLTSAPPTSERSVTGLAGKKVVHSSNATVTNASCTSLSSHMTTMFHGQVIDLMNKDGVGTFFAKVAATLVGATLRTHAAAPCTDLSTGSVDNDESS